MVQALALNTIHVCREPGETKDGKVTKRPVITVVEAGKMVDLSQEQFDEFEAHGAVRKATKVDRVMADDEGHVDVDPAAEPARAAAENKAIRR
jgi:hypothetical protein